MSDDSRPIRELLRQARAGEAAALQHLLEQYREYIRLVVRCRSRRQLKGRLDSSDLVQETFVRAVENFAQFEGSEEEEWRCWLGRIAEREVIHQLRHHVKAGKRAVGRERPIREREGTSITGSPRLDQWLLKTRTTPSLAAMRQERAVLLSNALARLPEDYREVLVLRNLQELDFPEVARQLQRSPGAVRVLWVRALKKLREELMGNEREPASG